MTSFQLLLFVHILAVVIWIGGALVGMLIGMQLRKSGDAAAFSKFCTAFATIAGPMFGGSAVLVGITGIWMVAMDGAPDFSDRWVSIGLTGWLVSLVMGATVVGMSWTKLGRVLAEPGATLEGAAALTKRAVTLTWIDLAIRVAVVYVMVWRPV